MSKGTEDRIIATRYLDSDGREVRFSDGFWYDVETGAKGDPAVRQVIRESAWTTDLRVSDEAAQ